MPYTWNEAIAAACSVPCTGTATGADTGKTCDLDANTDGTGACPAGCSGGTVSNELNSGDCTNAGNLWTTGVSASCVSVGGTVVTQTASGVAVTTHALCEETTSNNFYRAGEVGRWTGQA